MRVVFTVVIGILMLLAGATFLLQGIGILQGSMMSGQIFWAVVGIVLVGVGAVVVNAGLHLKPEPKQPRR